MGGKAKSKVKKPPTKKKGKGTPVQKQSKPQVQTPVISPAAQRYAKVKEGFLPRIVSKIDPAVDQWKLTEKLQKAPGSEEKDDAEEAKGWIDTVGVDTIGEGTDTAGNIVDYVGGGNKRNWSKIGENAFKGEWDDNKLQSVGLPIVSAVARATKLVISAVTYAKQMIQFEKDNKENGKTSTGEKVAVAGQTLEMVLTGLDAALAIVGTFHTALGRLPIIGAISGAISSAISLVMNAIQLSKVNRASKRMKEQRELAKNRIRNSKGNALKSSNVKYSEKKGKKRKLKFDLGKTTDEDIKDKKNNGMERERRLDEVTKEMRQAKQQQTDWKEENDEALSALEDYDITNELTQTSHKRRKEGVINLIAKDVVGIGTALAMLDPTALGGAIGAGINALIGIGMTTKKSVVTHRQKWRNAGKHGADINKSTKNKIRRRHHLAVLMYERLSGLKEYGIEDVEPNTAKGDDLKQIEKGVGPYEAMEERISAMGVAAPLYRANNAKNMVEVMRRGFYRDSGV